MNKSNSNLVQLCSQLKKKSIEDKMSIWKAIALYLEAPTRQKRIVNLSKIAKYSEENDVIIVPGKVLGGGDLQHKVTVAAFTFSKQAVDKIQKNKGSVLSIQELMEKHPKGTGIKILG